MCVGICLEFRVFVGARRAPIHRRDPREGSLPQTVQDDAHAAGRNPTPLPTLIYSVDFGVPEVHARCKPSGGKFIFDFVIWIEGS